MSKTKHTPGPWEVIQNAHSLNRDEWAVFPVGAGGDGQKRIACWIRTGANASLVAAAPDLLTACRWALGEFEGVECQDFQMQKEMRDKRREMLKAAIAKAEGK